ncbi:lactonase family protein [Paenibacillus sp. M1]|uniref:Lactonase family protein n=1 Tax=Paenibacillus haidiansis TaxID=1574488 RepID=A0ABU7VRG9_9BACL
MINRINEILFYVGAYAFEEEPGIRLCGLNPQNGELRLIHGTAGIKNPSFVILNADASRLYAVSEQERGAVAGYEVDPGDGRLTPLNSAPTEGADPCHLALSPDGGLLAANYSSGHINRFALDERGAIGGMTALVQHVGQGFRQDRQEAAHAHSIVPDMDGSRVYVSDLGLDQIMSYRVEDGKLTTLGEVKLPPGAGPRHFVFHPDGAHAYGINELNNTVTVYAYNPVQGNLEIVQQAATLPADFAGENYPADLHLSADGRYLYGSNRGHNSIVRFAVGQGTGMLRDPEWTGTGGNWPRNFAVLEDYVIVANQYSDNVVVLRRDGGTGSLTETGRSLAVKQPSCIEPVRRAN